MELLHDVRHVESHFDPFGDSVSVGERKEHGLRPMFHKLEIVFDAHDGTTR
jgi:hypothetical protein